MSAMISPERSFSRDRVGAAGSGPPGGGWGGPDQNPGPRGAEAGAEQEAVCAPSSAGLRGRMEELVEEVEEGWVGTGAERALRSEAPAPGPVGVRARAWWRRPVWGEASRWVSRWNTWSGTRRTGWTAGRTGEGNRRFEMEKLGKTVKRQKCSTTGEVK